MLLDNLRVVVALSVLVLFVAALVASTSFFGMGRWFPTIVTVGGTGIAAANLVHELWRTARVRRAARATASASADAAPAPPHAGSGTTPHRGRPKLDTEGAATSQEYLESARWFGIVLLLPLAMFLAGAVLGAAIWVAAFMHVVARQRRVVVLASTGGVVVLLLAYSTYLNLRLPQSVFLS